MKAGLAAALFTPGRLWAFYFVLAAILTGLHVHFQHTLSDQLIFLLRLSTSILAAYSIYYDSRLRNGAPHFSYSAWAIVLWPLIGPTYLIETRGWRGLAWTFAFLGLFVISYSVPVLIFEKRFTP